MTKTDLHALVDGLDDRAVDGAAVILRRLQAGHFDPAQAWFWTPEWLAGELEADRQAGAGEGGPVYEDADSLIAALRAERQ